MDREGGEPQQYRASISAEYGKYLREEYEKNGINVLEARPWSTLLDRCVEVIG